MNVAESAAAAQLPPDMSLPKKSQYRCQDGRVVTVRSLTMKGFVRLAAAFKDAPFASIKPPLTVEEFIEPDVMQSIMSIANPRDRSNALADAAVNLTADQKALLLKSRNEFARSCVRFACECAALAPAVFDVLTDISSAEFNDLPVEDGVAIIDKLYEVNDWESTIKALSLFLSRATAIGQAASRWSVI